jgi:hypothetical protein
MSVRVFGRSAFAALLLALVAPAARAQGEASPSPEVAPLPEGPPPEAPPLLNPAAPGFDDAPPETAEPDAALAEAPSSTGLDIESALGAQWWWASGKAMPGIIARAGHRWLWFDAEMTFIWLTESSADFDLSFLGSEFGFHAVFRPLYGERGELSAGIGADVYALWNLHGDEWQGALALRLEGHLNVTPRLGVFGSARFYPVATSGLELGTNRDHSRGLPLLFATGVEWRFP